MQHRRLSTRHLLATAACALMLPVAAISAGGCDSATSLCDRACDCTGCTSSELEDCYNTAEDTALDADQEGCTGEYNDFVSCAHEAFECDDGRVEYDDICFGESAELLECFDNN